MSAVDRPAHIPEGDFSNYFITYGCVLESQAAVWSVAFSDAPLCCQAPPLALALRSLLHPAWSSASPACAGLASRAALPRRSLATDGGGGCSYLFHQKEMLEDRTRMQAYYDAVFQNKACFEGKVRL